MEFILRTQELTKVYGDHEVIANVNMNVRKGSIYGFLGPNGAGKSTMMKLIMNLVKPTSGRIEIFGKEIKNNSYEQLGRMSAIIETPKFFPRQTAKEALELQCECMGYHNKNIISPVLKEVGLLGTENKRVSTFSLGMTQRLAIARAMITKPELILFDEPINGLDPEGILKMRDLLNGLREQGTTIVISSHILSEIEKIADTIGILKKGKLIKEMSMESIHEMDGEYIELEVDDTRKAGYILETALGITNFRIIGDELIRVYESERDSQQIARALFEAGINIGSIMRKQTSLEEYFTLLMGGDSCA